MTNASFPRSSKRVGVTAAAAMAASALLVLGFAGPAAADPETYEGGAKGQYTGNAASGEQVRMSSGGPTGTTLFNLRLEDGTVLTTYCIDFRTPIRSGAEYQEDSWANYPGKGDFAEPAKVHWVLQNSYPTLSVEALGEAADINRLTEKEAIAATQAAIWHFSNDLDLGNANKPNVKSLYEHLVSSAEELPQTAEPTATLKVTPSEASGEAGQTIGEFTVETSAESLPVDLSAPEGVELVDVETGEAVASVGNGDTFGVKVPEGTEPGEASFSLETKAELKTGRLFKGIEGQKETQTLITAEGGETTVSASGKVTWTAPTVPPTEEPSETPEPSPEPSETPEPSPEPSETPGEDKPAPPAEDKPGLPVTGGALVGLIAGALAAVGAGGGALYLSRKRKSSADDAAIG